MLEVKDLSKSYPKFHLNNVSFSLEPGYIMGFIGSNGAGKTTTLKSILNLVRKDRGDVKVFGKDFTQHEAELKQEIGFMFGGVDYYSKSILGKISDVTKGFYKNWDEEKYRNYMSKFKLDESKKLEELSSGMRVKYSMALALSHNAKLFIFDEPTSGLDPVARDDILEIFQELIEDGKRSILFSTHITSDLEKCADFITFIKDGSIVDSASKDDFIDSHSLVKGTAQQLEGIADDMISYKTHAFGFTGLMETSQIDKKLDVLIEPPSLEDIMIYYERREN